MTYLLLTSASAAVTTWVLRREARKCAQIDAYREARLARALAQDPTLEVSL